MKILVVHEVNYLSKIIYEFQILPEILSMLGHEVTIIDYDDMWQRDPQRRGTTLKAGIYGNVHRAYPRASVTVRRPGMIRLPVLSRISGAIAATWEIHRVIQQQKPDAVLLYGIPTNGMQTLIRAGRADFPGFCRAIDVTHELVPHALLVPPTHVLAKYVFNHAGLNIALTPHLKEYIRSYGVDESRIRLLPSGVDTDMFYPGDPNPGIFQMCDIRPGGRFILFMGTIYRFSGLDRVIVEFPAVLSAYPDTKLVIAGTGEDEDRLKRLAAGRGMGSHVIFTGVLPYRALPDLIRASTICINPFELNGITRNILPTKLFQYLACGKPVIATKLPGTLTFLKGEEHGVVYATLDSVATEICRLLGDREYMSRLSANGPRSVRTYDWHHIAKTLAVWIEEVA